MNAFTTERDLLQDLPDPEPAALSHSRRLSERIREEINNNGGRITFERFMEMALYEPGLGYYSAGSAKFGKEGDFITAPEISPLFSRCLAGPCAQVTGRYSDSVILELGAGSGMMAAELLAALALRDALPGEYWILETSADLRARQQQLLKTRLPGLVGRIRWLERLPERPFTGMILANEVLDALPVHRLCLEQNTIREMQVGFSDGRFNWQSRPAGKELAGQVEATLRDVMQRLPEGYKTEFNSRLPAFIASLSDILEGGVMLFIDYGYPRAEYYHPQRRDGTLLCHYRHRVHGDPFRFPGLQDITASVDFTAVAEAGDAASLELRGFTNQVSFLISCGLQDRINELAGDDGTLSPETSQQIKYLTLPGEMGERFKAMALTRNFAGPLPGFQHADQRHRL